MLEQIKGQFTIEGTVEDIFGGISGATRIAHISQTCLFTGDLEGESIAEYTAVFPRDGEGSFQGFQRVSGKLGEREGSFVLDVRGAYHRGQPRGQWTIVSKSGSGDFVHIRGDGVFEGFANKPASWRLAVDLRKLRASRTTVESEAVPTAPPAPTRTRTRRPIEAESAPVSAAPPVGKRASGGKKSDPPAEVAPASGPRKPKTPPVDPVPLPVAEATPTRQRRSKAA